MATVMHGRRRGATRATPPRPPFDMEPPSMQLPDGTDLRQVKVLSKSDWSRIHDQLNRRNIEEEKLQKIKEEREAQRQKSKDIVKNWGNTIVGQRQRKLEARKIREAKEEEERVAIDIEEAMYQATQRKEAIEKAKTQQYYQTDRVKAFHGALLLTEVLKEREAQIDLKKVKEHAKAGKDQDWLKLAQQEYEEGIRRDQEKAATRIQNTLETRNFQQLQVNEHERLKALELEEDANEREELKKLGIKFHMEKDQLQKLMKEEQNQLLFDNRNQIQELEILKKIQQQQEDEEDDECRVFAAAKRKMMKLRAERENDIHIEKQAQLEKIRDKLRAQIKEKVDNEDERIFQAEKEIEEKKFKEDEDRAMKVKKMILESAEHRQKKILADEQKRKTEKKKDLELMAIRREADEIFHQNELEKERIRKENTLKLKSYHDKQKDHSQKVQDLLRQEQLALDKANLELLGIEEQQFQEYAEKVIQHCEEGGRNTVPLKRAARQGAGGGCGPMFAGKGGIRPSYMAADQCGKQLPSYQGPTTEDIKDTINGTGTTKKRIGFVW